MKMHDRASRSLLLSRALRCTEMTLLVGMVMGLAVACAPVDDPPASAATLRDAAAALQETIDLHVFLEEWFTSKLSDTDAGFARFDAAISGGFTLIGPDGGTADRSSVVEAVRGDWGRWQADEQARIEVRNPQLVAREGDLFVVTYEEWQTTARGTTARASTVALRAREDDAAPFHWTHLHEVWIDLEGEGEEDE